MVGNYTAIVSDSLCSDTLSLEIPELFLDECGNCDEDPGNDCILGCTDSLACNYNEIATDDDGSCEYAEEYYDCDGNCINDSDGDEICDELEIVGCTDSNACNYNPSATDDDGSCEYAEEYYDCDGNCINDADGDEICDELDNCVDVFNPDQEDFNSDNIGDACDGIGLLENQNRKKLIKVVDILGRDFSFKTESNFLLYLYDDGSVEKKYKK